MSDLWLQNGTPLTNGWHHGGSVYFLIYSLCNLHFHDTDLISPVVFTTFAAPSLFDRVVTLAYFNIYTHI